MVAGRARTARAVEIRDHMLPLLRARGSLVRLTIVSNPKIRPAFVEWQVGEYMFSLRTPFTNVPKIRPARTYEEALLWKRARPLMPWGLDVWKQWKRMSLQWDDTGAVEAISFRPGDWEAEVLALR